MPNVTYSTHVNVKGRVGSYCSLFGIGMNLKSVFPPGSIIGVLVITAPPALGLLESLLVPFNDSARDVTRVSGALALALVVSITCVFDFADTVSSARRFDLDSSLDAMSVSMSVVVVVADKRRSPHVR
jgi:hypothetical protein